MNEDRYTIKEYRPPRALPEFDIRNERGFVARGINGPEMYKLKDLANRAEKLEAALRAHLKSHNTFGGRVQFACQCAACERARELLEPTESQETK